MERGANSVRDRIDRMSLGASVLMVDEITLIVALDETRAHQLGYGPTDRGHARFADTFAELSLNQAISIRRVGWQFSSCGQFRPHLLDGGAALVMASAK